MLSKPTAIPRTSGCYLFRNEAETIIYVGKARSLTSRLSNYFQRAEALSPKTRALMAEAASVEWIVTPSELDALVLENELIKQNQPRYNLRLKDDKSFPYVALDARTDFPAPQITRGHHVKGVRYFGPYVDVRALRATVDQLLEAYPLRSCTRHKFDYQARIGRPCLLFDIGKCTGPCVGAIDAAHYARLVQSWIQFLDGDVRPLRRRLEHAMTEASGAQRYEAAARARDALAALERAAGEQTVVLDDHTSLDVLVTAVHGARACVVRFRVRHGRVVGRSVHLVDRSMDESEAEILEAVFVNLFDDAGDVPPIVVVDSPSATTPLSTALLTSRRGRPVRVVVAQRGRRRRLVQMARADADAVMAREALRREADHNVRSRALQELGAALGLAQPPFRIECFDMSHLQGTNYVGSMVVFEDGLAQRKDYRHFNVREVLGNDDVGAMAEVVRRRLRHWDEDRAHTRFARADLLIVDGGLPQLHAAEAVVTELGLHGRVALAALAKRDELLYRPGSSDPVTLERGSESLYLVQRLRDEAHRFAITFHRSKRGASMVASSLEGVRGLGAARRERLLATFGSLDALRASSLEDLRALSWLPDDVATRLYDHVRAPRGPRLTKGDGDE